MPHQTTDQSPMPPHVRVAWIVDVESCELPDHGKGATYTDAALVAYRKIAGHEMAPVLEVTAHDGQGPGDRVQVDTEAVLAACEQGECL